MKGYTVKTDITFTRYDNVAAESEEHAIEQAQAALNRWRESNDLVWECMDVKPSIAQTFSLK